MLLISPLFLSVYLLFVLCIYMIYSKDDNDFLPNKKTFKVPNTENLIEDGKTRPKKYREITLHNICDEMQTDKYTDSGWPSVSGDALKSFAGKIARDQIYLSDDANESYSDGESEIPNVKSVSNNVDKFVYGTAYQAFGEGREGREACHTIAALCEVCAIDSLISNFIVPLQVH